MEAGLDVDLVRECALAFNDFIKDADRTSVEGFEWEGHPQQKETYVYALMDADLLSTGEGDQFIKPTKEWNEFLGFLVNPPTWTPIRNRYKLGASDFSVDSLYQALKQRDEASRRSGR